MTSEVTTWICPSRSRPENVERLLDGWLATKTKAHLVVAVEQDTPDAYREYCKLYDHYQPRFRLSGSNLTLSSQPVRKRIGPLLNELAPYYAEKYKAVGFLGDDHLPRTKNWDQLLWESIDDTDRYVAYGNDLLQGEALPTAVLIRSELIIPVQQFCPPDQLHLYLDNYWKALGEEFGMAYLGDVILEHLHPGAGKAESDQGYAEANLTDTEDGRLWREYSGEGVDIKEGDATPKMFEDFVAIEDYIEGQNN